MNKWVGSILISTKDRTGEKKIRTDLFNCSSNQLKIHRTATLQIPICFVHIVVNQYCTSEQPQRRRLKLQETQLPLDEAQNCVFFSVSLAVISVLKIS